MSRIRIDNPIQAEFSMVPNVLWTWPGLSFKAKGFFAYLLSHRDGSCPPVAGMEAETGLGRDARKAVMRELIAAGLCRWHIDRDASGRVLAKWLDVTTRPLLHAIAAANRAPENPSHGRAAVHATEKPSDGKSVAKRLKTRARATENPAILQNQNDIEAPAPSARPAPCAVPEQSEEAAQAQACASTLSDFQKSRVRSGQSVWHNGKVLVPGSVKYDALRQALRCQVAEKRCARVHVA